MENYGKLRKAIPKEHNSMNRFVREFHDKNSDEDFCRVQDMLPPSTAATATATTSSLFPSMSKLSLKRPPLKLAPIFNRDNFSRNKRKQSKAGGSSQLGIEFYPVPKKKLVLERSQPLESTQSTIQTKLGIRPERECVFITGSVQFVMKNFKTYPQLKAIYEVYGNVMKITKTKIRYEHIILMRSESGPILQGFYYDFENILLDISTTSMVRCIGNFNSQNRFHIHKIEQIQNAPHETELTRIQNVSAFALLQIQNNSLK